MKNLIKESFFILFIIIIISGCATIPTQEFTPYNPSASAEKICILYHATKFRNEVVYNLTKKFNKNGTMVAVDDIANFKKHDPQNYDLVIVFSGMYLFIPGAVSRHYLWLHKDVDNILHVFCTGLTPKGITVKTNSANLIDTISAASLKKNTDKLTETIYLQAMKKLTK